jgi:hypothetical protein
MDRPRARGPNPNPDHETFEPSGQTRDAATGPGASDVRVKTTNFADEMVADLVRIILANPRIMHSAETPDLVLKDLINISYWVFLNRTDGGLSGNSTELVGVICAKIFQHVNQNPGISNVNRETIKRKIRELLASEYFRESNSSFEQTMRPVRGPVNPSDLPPGPDSIESNVAGVQARSQYPTTPTSTTLRILSRLVDRLEL